MDTQVKTGKSYGFLWTREKDISPKDRWHFNSMQEAIDEPIVRGNIGIDVGSGCGYDTYIMAKNNPSVKIISLDLSDGVFCCKKLSASLENVFVIKSSILDAPVKNNVFDFAYCYGVLHHTNNPELGLKEIGRILKKGAAVFLYLYENHSDNIVKFSALTIIKVLRRITTKIPQRILYIISFLLSPFVVISFSLPARSLKKFKITKSLADKIPFNFGTHLFSLTGDIYDRFSAPVEQRFNREEVFNLLNKSGFINIKICKARSFAGWITYAYKE